MNVDNASMGIAVFFTFSSLIFNVSSTRDNKSKNYAANNTDSKVIILFLTRVVRVYLLVSKLLVKILVTN